MSAPVDTVPLELLEQVALDVEAATRRRVAVFVEARVAEIDARRQERMWLPEEVLMLARIVAEEIRSGAVA